jgi:hypothetical protein
VLLHLVFEHAMHGVLCYASTDAEVAPQGNHTEIERSDRPDNIHDPHLLRVSHLVYGDGKGANEGGS